MSERPFMQLYTSDFLGDTQDLSAEYIGSYLLLLMTMWNAGGELAFDEVKLARVARLTVEEWRLAWTDLGRFFDVVDGKLTHGRVAEELAKFARKSAARKQAGSLGGKAKSLKDKNTGLAIATSNGMASSRNQNKQARVNATDPTDGSPVMVTIDRSRPGEDLVWAECEKLTKKAPSGGWTWSWPKSVVDEARANLEQARAGVMH
jgi:uncharacterized protein YdaU (DUF1376 family)